MKKVSLSILFLLLIVSCGSEDQKFLSIVKEATTKIKECTALMHTMKDKSSTDSAAPKIKEYTKEFEDINSRLNTIKKGFKANNPELLKKQLNEMSAAFDEFSKVSFDVSEKEYCSAEVGKLLRKLYQEIKK